MNPDVIVIGAGLSGLACALRLQQAGLRANIIEAADRPGGRIATDTQDGFLLDRGFQVLQTWYPEAQHMLDYDALDLRPFYPGALVRIGRRFHRVSDIWRRPARLPEMLASPVGTTGDKLRLLALRHRALKGGIADLYARPETTALALLQQLGFSRQMQERFFKPFFAGVFFEPDLDVSSRAFEFVFRAFALGDTALPAHGMAQIPLQLAERLVPESLHCGQRAKDVRDGSVLLDSGERLSARAIIVATDGNAAADLVGTPAMPTRGTTCLYFAAAQAPFDGPDLVLNGTGQGPVNSLLSPSNLSASYAPPGQALIAVNVFGSAGQPDAVEAEVRSQLLVWYGKAVNDWQRLAIYRLPAALPAQRPPVQAPAHPRRLADGLWLCGESVAPPSIHWALRSGTTTAEAVLDDLHGARDDRMSAGTG